MSPRAIVCGTSLTLLVAVALAAPLMYSTDFEAPRFHLGWLNGQDGWHVNTADGVWGFVFVDADPANAAELAVMSRANNPALEETYAWRDLAPPAPGGRVSWDWYCDGASANPDGPVQWFRVRDPSRNAPVAWIAREADGRLTAQTRVGNRQVAVDSGLLLPADQWVHFEVIVRRDARHDVWMNGALLFSDLHGFSANISQLRFGSNGAFGQDGNVMYIDNIRVEPAAAAVAGPTQETKPPRHYP